MRRAADGGLLLAGFEEFGADTGVVHDPGATSGLLFKVDASGNELWSMRIKREVTNHAHILLERKEGGYYLGGHIQTAPNGTDAMWLMRLDTARNVVWEKLYSMRGYEHVHSADETADGGCVMAGHSSADGRDQYWILRVDSAGEEVWGHLVANDESIDTPYRVVTTRDGGCAIFGTSTHATKPFSTGWLLVLDANGSTVVDRHYGRPTSFTIMTSGRPTSDGGYLLVGTTPDSTSGNDIYVVKTDPSGEVEWERRVGAEGTEAGADVMEDDDGYVVVGITNSQSLHLAGGMDMLLARLTRSGDLAEVPHREPSATPYPTPYPNPVLSGAVRIELPGEPGRTDSLPRITIFDLRGGFVRMLDDAAAGPLAVPCYSWDLRDAEGAAVAAGVYFYRSDDGALQGKIVVAR